jgi:outer membrane protein assembly factor BamB
MNSEELLEALKRSGLVEEGVLGTLRRQLAAVGGKTTPQQIVQRLVADGQLTKAQGERLLSAGPGKAPAAQGRAPADDDLEVLDDEPLAPGPKTAAAKSPILPDDDLEVLPDAEDDLLPPPAPSSRRPAPPSASLAETRGASEDLGLVPLDEDALLSSPLRQPSTPRSVPQPKSVGSAPAPPPKKKPGRKRRIWREEVAPAAPELANQVDDLLGTAAFGKADRGRRGQAARPGARNAWDSPLMLIGGGSLLLMLIVGAALLWLMRRQTGDQALEMAEQDYKSASFSQAIYRFDQYLEKYPKHGSVSIAKVHRGLAEMRQASQNTGDWSKALATAKTALDQISGEVEFPSAQEELARILPAIAQGLADQAQAKPSTKLVDDTREAVSLVDKYVPANLQPKEQLRDIEALLAHVVHRLDRDKALNETVGTMKQAVSAGDPEKVYAARHALVGTYPELAEDQAVLNEMAAAATAESARVKYVAEPRDPATDEISSPTLVSVALTATTGQAAPVEDGDPVITLVSGGVYALDPRTGRPRWRRFAGFDTDYVPQVVKTAAGSAALVVDSTRAELLLVDAANGKPRWRQKIDNGSPAAPVVLRDRVLVASRSGKLLSIDLETGLLRGYTQLPQPINIPPAIEPRERLLYQVADHANLYVLSAEKGDCPEVFYLGHEPESIATPPLVVGHYVIVAVNSGAEDAVLRILLADEEGLKLKPVESVALRGHVFSPPAASGRALVVATDRGALYSFELNPPDSDHILTKLSEKPPDEKAPIVPFVASRGTELWLSGYGVTRYDIQSSRGALAPKWIVDDQGVVLHAPQVLGPVVVFASHGERSAGVTVSAVAGSSGSRYWETKLAVPPAAAPLVTNDSDKAAVLTTAGALYEVPAANLASRKLIDAPTSTVADKLNLPADQPLVELADHRSVFAAGQLDTPAGLREVLIYDPSARDNKLRLRKLIEPAANRPVAFAGGLLVPGKIGQVFVVDPDTGRNVLAPFQPVVEVGREIAWTEPAVLDDRQALICDGAAKLYRLSVVDAPQPHLEAAATLDLTSPLVSPLGVSGEFVYAVDAGNRLRSFRLPDLAPATDWRLDSRAVWGPRKVADNVLVATLAGQLTCVDRSGGLVWQTSLGPGCIVGNPLESRGTLIVCCNTGTLYRLAADTGKIVAETPLGQPLAVGPVRWHDRLLLAGSDGTLHVVAEPK